MRVNLFLANECQVDVESSVKVSSG